MHLIGIVIVSHSHQLACGIKELALELARNDLRISTAGGMDEVALGTSAERIYQAILDVYTEDGVLILFDLGGALFSTQVAIEMLQLHQQEKIKLSDAPIVEGAVVAAVEASLGHSLEQVSAAVDATRHMRKIP